jgi:hypothetical protein
MYNYRYNTNYIDNKNQHIEHISGQPKSLSCFNRGPWALEVAADRTTGCISF